MGATLLQRSGYPVVAANREAWSMWETLRSRLKDQGITVLWIDEAHDLFCADRNLILRALKALMQGDGADFREVIGEYCRIAGLAPPTEADLIPRLFRAARHRFGRCVETVIGAIEFALEGEADRLDIGHFAEFWGLQEGCPLGGNIFLAPDWSRIDPDAEDDTPVIPHRRRRRA